MAKTHDLALARIQWLLSDTADVVIIATGWHGVTKPSRAIEDMVADGFVILETRDAIRLYNELRRAGKRVAIHLHSTC